MSGFGAARDGYTADEVDELINKFEERCEKVVAAQGRMVKLKSAEADLLALAEKARDLFSAAVKDKDRSRLIEVFGGRDNDRFTRFRNSKLTVEFSEMWAKDPRWQDLEDKMDAIEKILEDNGAWSKARDRAMSFSSTMSRKATLDAIKSESPELSEMQKPEQVEPEADTMHTTESESPELSEMQKPEQEQVEPEAETMHTAELDRIVEKTFQGVRDEKDFEKDVVKDGEVVEKGHNFSGDRLESRHDTIHVDGPKDAIKKQATTWTDITWHGKKCLGCQAMSLYRNKDKKTGKDKKTRQEKHDKKNGVFLLFGPPVCPGSTPASWLDEYNKNLQQILDTKSKSMDLEACRVDRTQLKSFGFLT